MFLVVIQKQHQYWSRRCLGSEFQNIGHKRFGPLKDHTPRSSALIQVYVHLFVLASVTVYYCYSKKMNYC